MKRKQKCWFNIWTEYKLNNKHLFNHCIKVKVLKHLFQVNACKYFFQLSVNQSSRVDIILKNIFFTMFQ